MVGNAVTVKPQTNIESYALVNYPTVLSESAQLCQRSIDHGGLNKIDTLADSLIATPDDDRPELKTAGQLRVAKFPAQFERVLSGERERASEILLLPLEPARRTPRVGEITSRIAVRNNRERLSGELLGLP